ncbi:MAG: Bug family tripartite tricarboxylate transporter substrate binding protein [Hydrogenophaga sp.]|jgi:tripartite-type tricarboxylate transporter receptor subunit TctC|uniref:Bug family tripartite tricarboxylate transporter substrate binding protein n=1 Tax=Hydrogenophaga sp. TaxID=1904254 RepID=UPI001DF12E4C|nr:tripartite tricarboxylate transporter substrate binding protein [Hydrogenophaga sp.]MBW0171836.1 tripartite tricarboxylate transporter substrate binding protein [Hydrogenophaga sp.]MBW0182242.1 tripartite tricarboxylate transporter substrate binding protein [Hydrogenophaga sp.]
MMQRRQVLAWGGAGALGLLGNGTAQAQAYPGGPITLVLPLQAGTASDVAVRHMAERLGQRMAGNSFVVENVAAAAGLVGLERLSRVRPDGRTVAALNNSIMTILPHLQAKNIKVDTRRDLVPVAGIANIPTFFAVPGNSNIKTIADLIKTAKTERVTYSSGGIGSPQHMATEMFNAYTGSKLEHVPYRGASQAALAVATGEVQVMSMALSLAQPFLSDQRVRLIGYCGSERHAQFRELPTLQEAGVKNYDYSSWIALFLPRDVPQDALAELRRQAQAIALERDFQVQLIRSGLEPWARNEQQLARIVEQDYVRWDKIIRDANIPTA